VVNAKSAAAVYSNQIVLFGCHGLPILLRTAELVDTGACRAGVSFCTGQPRLSVCWVRPSVAALMVVDLRHFGSYTSDFPMLG
jgi:hypothetical protein